MVWPKQSFMRRNIVTFDLNYGTMLKQNYVVSNIDSMRVEVHDIIN